MALLAAGPEAGAPARARVPSWLSRHKPLVTATTDKGTALTPQAFLTHTRVSPGPGLWFGQVIARHRDFPRAGPRQPGWRRRFGPRAAAPREFCDFAPTAPNCREGKREKGQTLMKCKCSVFALLLLLD